MDAASQEFSKYRKKITWSLESVSELQTQEVIGAVELNEAQSLYFRGNLVL